MNKIIILILSIIMTMGMSACSMNVQSDNEKNSTQALTKDGYYNITPQEAKKRLDSEKDIILLDVRTAEEYKESHIPGSLLIPVTNLQNEAPAKLKDKDATIFVYCRSGNRSVTASVALVKLGYKNVYNLGGINSWPYETEAGD